MSERNTVVRGLHDLGLAMWFGGSLAGAVGFNGAAADVSRQRNKALAADRRVQRVHGDTARSAICPTLVAACPRVVNSSRATCITACRVAAACSAHCWGRGSAASPCRIPAPGHCR
jgi:hypothetical protein